MMSTLTLVLALQLAVSVSGSIFLEYIFQSRNEDALFDGKPSSAFRSRLDWHDVGASGQRGLLLLEVSNASLVVGDFTSNDVFVTFQMGLDVYDLPLRKTADIKGSPVLMLFHTDDSNRASEPFVVTLRQRAYSSPSTGITLGKLEVTASDLIETNDMSIRPAWHDIDLQIRSLSPSRHHGNNLARVHLKSAYYSASTLQSKAKTCKLSVACRVIIRDEWNLLLWNPLERCIICRELLLSQNNLKLGTLNNPFEAGGSGFGDNDDVEQEEKEDANSADYFRTSILGISGGKRFSRRKRGLIGWFKDQFDILKVKVYNPENNNIEDEYIPKSVKVALRAIYGSSFSTADTQLAREKLKQMTFKKGQLYDTSGNKTLGQITDFIQTYSLADQMSQFEIEKPADYKTMNEFFSRKIKDEARPLASPNDTSVAVSAADCRLNVFTTVDSATKFWIKGKGFTIRRMFGNSPAKERLSDYEAGSVAIFRLAPQDYHRVHFPIDGKIKSITVIDGEYFSVNPYCIKSSVDVFGINRRNVIEIESPEFGPVVMVMVGATLVGSIELKVAEGDEVKRGQELGLFKFGGSTCVTLFQKDRIRFDDLYIRNSEGGRKAVETLVKVRSSVLGHAVAPVR